MDLVLAHARDERELARQAIGVERLAQAEHLVGGRARAELDADRIADAAQELDVGMVELAGALTDPQHVRRAVVPLAAERIDARERLFVAEQQRFVAGVEVDRVEIGMAVGRHAAGLHELQCAIDAEGHLVVALAGGARRDEVAVPRMHPREVGETTLGEGAQQVERRRGLVVRAQ